jgi:hypothetical protein
MALKWQRFGFPGVIRRDARRPALAFALPGFIAMNARSYGLK